MLTAAIRVNGAAVAHVGVADRGFMYGDGVFRTLRARDGQAQSWARHYRRLGEDCATLMLPCPDEAALLDDLAAVAGTEGDCVVKIVVTRGVSGRGYAPRAGAPPCRVVMAVPPPAYPPEYATAGVAVRWCDLRLAEQPRLAGVKHLNRLENVLARMEWSDPEIAEGLLLDGGGRVIEGTQSNLFVCHNGVLATPALTRCGVAGVTRERVLEWVTAQGMAAEVRDIAPEEVLTADEVFLCNSVAGLWPVRALATRRWPVGPLAAALGAHLNDPEGF